MNENNEPVFIKYLAIAVPLLTFLLSYYAGYRIAGHFINSTFWKVVITFPFVSLITWISISIFGAIFLFFVKLYYSLPVLFLTEDESWKTEFLQKLLLFSAAISLSDISSQAIIDSAHREVPILNVLSWIIYLSIVMAFWLVFFPSPLSKWKNKKTISQWLWYAFSLAILLSTLSIAIFSKI